MRCGISTACFFPENTLTALREVSSLGAPITEIFLNTPSEMEPAFVAALQGEAERSGIEVVSVHPCLSMLDGFFFASSYAGRLVDGIALYRRFYEICQLLGARFLVFHGDHAHGPDGFPEERYAEHVRRLAEVGREYGVTLCHENVSYCRLNTPAAVRRLRPLLREAANFVLDIKQARRNGEDPMAMLAEMGDGVRHLHISDYAGDSLCTPPGAGSFSFRRLLRQLAEQQYQGDLLIELYQDGYGEPRELAEAMHHINALIAELEGGLP